MRLDAPPCAGEVTLRRVENGQHAAPRHRALRQLDALLLMADG